MHAYQTSDLSPITAIFFDQRQIVSRADFALEEQGRAAAFQLTLRDDGDTVAQKVRFVHEMRRQDDGSTWITSRAVLELTKWFHRAQQ